MPGGPLPDTRLRGKRMESALGVLYGLWAVSVTARKNLLLWGLGLCHVSLGVVRENGALSGPEAVRRPGTWALGISETRRERREAATCRDHRQPPSPPPASRGGCCHSLLRPGGAAPRACACPAPSRSAVSGLACCWRSGSSLMTVPPTSPWAGVRHEAEGVPQSQ